MRFGVRLLFALGLRSLVSLAGEGPEGIAQLELEALVPEGSVQDSLIKFNQTRYKIQNISITGQNRLAGDLLDWPNRMSLLHPNFWTYWIHTAAQIIATVMALKCPKILLVFLVLAVLCWPISLIFNQPIWRMRPLAMDWWLMCVKSIIVNICPTVPMLLCLILRPSRERCHCAGIWTYCILWLNVFWTLFFLPMAFNAVSITNAICGLSLCVSLIIHNVAVCRRGAALFEVKGDIVYGYGTSLSWLVCYTVWNGLFVVEAAVCLIFQDVAFWAMMAVFYYWSKCHSGIENYFAMARPISLSVFIATSDWPGLIDYFRYSEPLGLDVTSHCFFLFAAVVNVAFSVYVLFWAVCCLWGCCGADEYFRKTFASQQLGDESDWESDEVSEQYDEGFLKG